MSTEQSNANKTFLGEEVTLAGDSEEEREPGTPEGPSSTSPDRTNHPQSILQIEDAISVVSNAEFLSSPQQQQSAVSLPSTPQSVVPATINMLPQTGVFHHLVLHGQDMNSIPHNEQLLLSAPAAMVNSGTTSNLLTELHLKPPSQPITPASFLEQLDKIRGRYQKMAKISGSSQHGPQPGAAYADEGAPDHQVLVPTMSNQGILGFTWRALTEAEKLDNLLPMDPKAADEDTDPSK